MRPIKPFLVSFDAPGFLTFIKWSNVPLAIMVTELSRIYYEYFLPYYLI